MLSYSITAGNAAGIFAINASTGAITVANSVLLDHELAAQHGLTVQVSDGVAASSAAITIDVTDLNEFAPVVNDQTFSVAENAANGAAVGTVLATDADSSQTRTYSITAGNAAGIFAIDGSTGAITVANGSLLDRETTAQYVLTVRVTDSGTPSQNDSAAITIDVTDVNEFAPVVSDQSFSVLENSANGTVVGTLPASDADTSQTLSYAITAGNASGIFAINAATGQITVANSSLLDHESAALHTLTVTVTDSGTPAQSAAAEVQIAVGDVNEFSPVAQDAAFGISENAANGATVGVVSASDADSSQTLSYAITAGNGAGAFAIDPVTGRIYVADASQLDPLGPQYVLTVTVADDLALQRSDTATITIDVVANQPPVIADTSFAVPENSANGTVVGSVAASDPEAAAAAWADSAWAHRKALSIDHTRVAGNLTNFPLLVSFGSDAELAAGAGRVDGLDIFFTAADGVTRLDHEIELFQDATGQLVAWVRIPSLSATTDTQIYMYYGNAAAADQQNAAAVWDSNFELVHHFEDLQDSTTHAHDATLIDNASIGGSSGMGGYGLLDGANDGFLLGDINALDGIQRMTVSAWVQPDALSQWMNIVSKTSGSDSDGWELVAGGTFSGFGGGSNDPAFHVGSGMDSLPEGGFTKQNLLRPGTQRHVVAVFDGTQGSDSARLKLYIDGVAYAVTAPQGVPSQTPVTSNPLRFGTTTLARGSDFDGQIDEVRVSTSARSAAWIATEFSNQKSPSVFVTSGAEQSVLTYAITGGDPGGVFAIDARTGQITVADGSQLDHEATSQYVLQVTVTDSGSPALSSTANVTVGVSDVNEWDPVALDGALSVAENSAVGTVVGAVAASDADTSQTLSYAISGGNTGGAFAINAATGQITVANAGALDHEATPQYTLTVTVTDSLAPTRSDTASITIDVTDVNEWNPVVAPASFGIAENAANGAVLGTVVATDADTSQSLSYAITAGDPTGIFAIDAATGQITLADGSQLDHESAAQYVLTVTASDDLAPQRSGSAAITIDVGDVNEFDPVALDASMSVLESAANGAVVGTVAASDADTSQTLSYAITGGDPSGIFAIDAATGQITVADASQLDHESVPQIVLTVTVTDSLAPARSDTAVIAIDVADANEFDPVAADAAMAIAENAANGSVLGTVVATDADTSQSLSYAITAGDPTGIFAIDPITGEISVADGSQLDHEAQAQYVLTVTVTDDLAPQRSGTATITIDVVDVNEFDPAPLDAAMTIPENSANGSVLGTVVATDADLSQSLSYAITGGDPTGVFAIDAATGQISVADGAQLDHEAQAQYVLTVTVTDDLAPQRSGAATITIAVTDVNEFAPVASGASLSVNREAKSGVVVGRVSASDADTSQALVYAIVAGDPGGVFAIDPATGVISVMLSGPLLGQDPAQYVLTVSITDSGAPALGTTATVSIAVTDFGPVDPPPGYVPPEQPAPAKPVPPPVVAPAAPLRRPLPELPAPRVFVYDLPAPEFDPRIVKLPSLLVLTPEHPDWEAPEVRVKLKPAVSDAAQIEPALWDALDRVHQDMQPHAPVTYWLAEIRSLALLVSIGSLQWLLRGPSLLSTLLVSLPAWMNFDPLPIVTRGRRRDEEDEDEAFENWREGTQLEDLFEPEAEAEPGAPGRAPQAQRDPPGA